MGTERERSDGPHRKVQQAVALLPSGYAEAPRRAEEAVRAGMVLEIREYEDASIKSKLYSATHRHSFKSQYTLSGLGFGR